ncbi:MAG: DNA alkylation repair protein, partial [Pseudomonadota bacterium]
DYIGAGKSKFIFLNLKVPYIRQSRKSGYTFSHMPYEEQWKIWNHIWDNTSYFEAALCAVHYVNSRSIEELHQYRKILLKWQKRVDNWALSDELSNCYSRLLEYDKSEILPKYQIWNKSNNPWERRQSMVGLLYYSRFRKKTLSCSKILSFVEPHLADQHYYVQKAVGWTLRECWNVYPQQTMKFLKKYAADIPPGGWTAATEKLSKTSKDELKMLRARKS